MQYDPSILPPPDVMQAARMTRAWLQQHPGARLYDLVEASTILGPWRVVNQQARDFSLQAGMVVEVETDEGPKQLIVGNVSEDGSTDCGCDHPDLDVKYGRELVLRYRMINWKESS